MSQSGTSPQPGCGWRDNRVGSAVAADGHQLSDVEQALLALASAEAGFLTWRETTPDVRRDVFWKAAAIIEEESSQLVALMMSETSCGEDWARFNIRLATNNLREAAALPSQIQGATMPSMSQEYHCFTFRRPVGVVLAISPWNAPLGLAARAIAAPIACGNSVVLKASEVCPQTHVALARILSVAGLRPGVLNVVVNDESHAPHVVEAMIRHPSVRRVNFTGSTRVGSIVARIAGECLKPVLLELGGKAAVIVLEDADLEAAAEAAVSGAIMNQGQICMSTERVIVVESVADDLASRIGIKVIAAARALAADRRRSGCMINDAAAERAVAMVERAVLGGATLMSGGRREGAFLAPTVLDHVDERNAIFAEETFAPILCISRARSVDHAIELAEATPFALTSSIYTADLELAFRLAARLSSGVVNVNGPTVYSQPHMPFGGARHSGFGRFGGTAAIQEFTDLQSVYARACR